ncbi:TPA: tail fiber domain-containing protein [Escherichia coli]
MIYTTGTIAINGNTVTGTGTNFSAPLSLIRVGCTLIAISNPIQIFTVTEIKSGTELSVTPAANPAIAAGTKFSILLSDSISVDGLAQDVAETLRYYQGKESEIATAVEWWNEFGGDGQMEQLLANIRAETAKSTANAQKTESDKNAAAASKTAAANSATAAKASQDAAKASETAASSSKTAAATSETNAAKSAADALNYRNQAQGIVGDSIGLGSTPRDCPDISGNPSGYIGFMRIREQATGFPSIASGEAYLTGFICGNDGSPSYSGIFQGWSTKSLYTYRWASTLGPQWTRHARKDEVSRFVHSNSDRTTIFSSDNKNTGCYLQLDAGGRWGYYSPTDENWKPLAVEQGGTGARDAATAREKLGLSKNNDLQLRNLGLVNTSDVTTGWIGGGQLNSQLISTSGTLRAEAVFIAETNVTSPSQATIKISTPSEGARYFNFNTKGQILAETAIFRSTYANPLIINSATPTISFQENDRPEGSPYYNLVVDGGNWRIQKNGDGYNSEYVIGYNYKFDEIEVPSLLANVIQKPKNLDKTKENMLIPYTGMGRWIDYNAPTGAEAGKYYPVIIKQPSHFNGDFLNEIAMRTKSISGSEEPNCNTLHVWVRSAGWSDMGSAAFGHYFCYAQNENAILCVRGTSKGNYEYNAIYVRGDAFPIRLAATVGSTVIIPTADWSPNTEPNSPTYKWGITNSSDGISIETYGINGNLLDFTGSLSGFYCSDTFRNKYGDGYLVVQANGIITPPNGLGLFSDQDWNAQQSDGVNKFKVIAGNVNTPESSVTCGGFHVGFSGSHVTQFAGRNSKFYARSFEAGVDKGWRRLATLNDNLVQRWTGYQEFKSTDFYSDAFDRKLSLVVRSSAARNGALELWGDPTRPTVLEYKVRESGEGTSTKYAFYAQQNTDDSIVFNVNGAVTCVTVTQSSDRDLKDNIQVIGDATEAIRKMNGYTYTLKENGLPYAGVIAQEVMEALPEAVGSFTHYGEALQGPTTDGNELREETRYLNVDYAAVTGLLVQVARETDNRVTELEEENASLRANIAVMDERIAKLEALVSKLTGSEK